MYQECSFSYQPSLENGKSYTFKVYAVDSVGNIGQPVEYDWLVGKSYQEMSSHNPRRRRTTGVQLTDTNMVMH